MPIPVVPIGERPHRVACQSPTRTPDGRGGFIEGWSDLAPGALYVQIQPATAQALERIGAGTVLGTATHVITGPWHPGITLQSRLVFGARIFSVIGIANRDERGIEGVWVCVEHMPDE
jgi:head-tail adaptor